MELVLATRNVHKILELRQMLKGLGPFDIYTLRDFPDYIPPEEVGLTFEENACLKALHAAKALNKYVLADDSGLIVPALNGDPGVFSARYAGENATDKDNRAKLKTALSNLNNDERSGYFECALALADPSGIQKCVRGTCEGYLILEERGSQGFGYDPLFVKWDYGKTLAELEPDVKNRISHRRKALDKLLPALETLLCTT
ncbi:MAG: RdgB/HAM1 family non-canonical purine NTP pyrophosphatase [Chlamydiales bacterium]|nr:RdgB/HAM1 family non-canonical purine NTP pyrophosphatase [Chlamydiales bacterium]